jgi:hypothetical protein
MMAQYNAQRVCKLAQDRDFRDFKNGPALRNWMGTDTDDEVFARLLSTTRYHSRARIRFSASVGWAFSGTLSGPGWGTFRV